MGACTDNNGSFRKYIPGLVLVSVLFLTACVRQSVQFDPEDGTQIPYAPVTLAAPTQQPTATISPTQPVTDNSLDCIDNLTYLEDLTIPDGTVVAPGASLDKRWLVKNSGTCNWDDGYQIRFTGGSDMGAETTQALYPARSGAEANIQIEFTAPIEPGVYRSAWSAYNPSDAAFGDPVYIYIVVEEP